MLETFHGKPSLTGKVPVGKECIRDFSNKEQRGTLGLRGIYERTGVILTTNRKVTKIFFAASLVLYVRHNRRILRAIQAAAEAL